VAVLSALAWTVRACAGAAKVIDCRCFGSDRAPRVAPPGAFWCRTVLPTVARWFMPDARETVDNLVQVRAALRCVTPYVLVWVFYVVGYRGVL
jgi:hypothetical protein